MSTRLKQLVVASAAYIFAMLASLLNNPVLTHSLRANPLTDLLSRFATLSAATLHDTLAILVPARALFTAYM
jgi:hypothetical protein